MNFHEKIDPRFFSNKLQYAVHPFFLNEGNWEEMAKDVFFWVGMYKNGEEEGREKTSIKKICMQISSFA